MLSDVYLSEFSIAISVRKVMKMYGCICNIGSWSNCCWILWSTFCNSIVCNSIMANISSELNEDACGNTKTE